MAEIIPRWEWRTFTKNGFGESEDLIRGRSEAQVRQSTEYYILSRQSMNNTKVRDDLMDIKTLKAVNADKLEQWNPILKASFPIAADTLPGIFAALGVPQPALKKDAYTFRQYIDELILPVPDLKVVHVVTFDGKPTRTVAVEQEDPQRVIDTVRSLKLERFENINYLRAMKSAVGMA